ncbi:hypothetical protein [Jannaschia helgolandensis]|uniref:Uncharacterized protein n=1 Tax=Jannaschia helgolandensis TaxID=188906 RepID=A0A1H7P367_9RHOB|nr:hypothetical protein [Jannaschia helgolandensis]SEL29894.1 hypothetical protein SAMN04488526_2392 [Jannaschia helgolandensis]
MTAILMQAYRDLFVSVRDESNASFTTQTEQDRAIEFLTDLSGGNARHRNALCALIGWDGDVLAARVRAMMEGDDFAPPTPDATPATLERHAAAVVRLRERWRHLQTPHQRRAA